jgi:hypothetical protein
MTKFEIGLTQSEPAWLQILNQERVNCQIWDHYFSEETPRVVIVNHPLTEKEAGGFRAFVQAGAGILTDFDNLARLVPDFKCEPLEVIHYIEPDSNPVFDSLGLIDLELPGFGSQQANCGKLDNESAALCAHKLGKGYVIALPFDLAQVLRDQRRCLKAFYHEGPELPYEETAMVSRDSVRRLCVNALRELSRQIHVPYVHLWYYPESKRAAFAFRVDSDFAGRDQIEKTVELANQHDLKFSWYVNAKAHRPLLGYFNELAGKGHDIQLHCFEHKVFDDLGENLSNIRSGLEAMKSAGLETTGFAGPFGHWNPALNQAMEESGIRYSSEFGLAYDDFPFFNIMDPGLSKVMQIPVHPICVGRLLQARLKDQDIVDYYKNYFRTRYSGREPLFIYDHPHRIAGNYETFDALLKIVAKASDVWQTTLTRFYQWWVERSRLEYDVWAENGLLTVEGYYDVSTAVHILDGEREALVPIINRQFQDDELAWKPVKRCFPYQPEMAQARKLGRHLWLREKMWHAGKLLSHG